MRKIKNPNQAICPVCDGTHFHFRVEGTVSAFLDGDQMLFDGDAEYDQYTLYCSDCSNELTENFEKDENGEFVFFLTCFAEDEDDE